ncbi:MAG: methyltransferase domain-containing protein [Deltaproteobacteria bacterium]|nr:methyltransferase domain-containing protein [Deltaproteobacteria bacterium]
MRVVDLDRDMSDVIPTGTTRDSAFLFARMTEATLAALHPGPGRRILDVASGMGQDTRALCEAGALAVGAEPSARMTACALLAAGESASTAGVANSTGPRAAPHWVRGFADALPFADDSFDAAFCKGALDHFDRPLAAVGEMARVVKPGGRVVLAIANFESLACRLARAADGWREGFLRRPPRRGRRPYDVPADHFTRFDFDLMREQAGRHLEALSFLGISLAWGLATWSRAAAAMPAPLATRALRSLDALARRFPRLADVIILSGCPR